MTEDQSVAGRRSPMEPVRWCDKAQPEKWESRSDGGSPTDQGGAGGIREPGGAGGRPGDGEDSKSGGSDRGTDGRGTHPFSSLN